ncbi:hypothetical protein [Streptomyces xanthochromogenes]|uniref:hypothetical protein n=1 Tax=Streptomyces xanthochromogenes TaxID=67384 RepID=UPI00344A1557
MPTDGRRLVVAACAELITAVDPYYRGIDADAHLPHWISVRPLTSTSPGGEHIADLAGGRAGSSTPSSDDRGSTGERAAGGLINGHWVPRLGRESRTQARP